MNHIIAINIFEFVPTKNDKLFVELSLYFNAILCYVIL